MIRSILKKLRRPSSQRMPRDTRNSQGRSSPSRSQLRTAQAAVSASRHARQRTRLIRNAKRSTSKISCRCANQNRKTGNISCQFRIRIAPRLPRQLSSCLSSCARCLNSPALVLAAVKPLISNWSPSCLATMRSSPTQPAAPQFMAATCRPLHTLSTTKDAVLPGQTACSKTTRNLDSACA